MFIVFSAVEKEGLLNTFIDPFKSTLFAGGQASVLSIFGLSRGESAPNVPFVAVMMPVFKAAGASVERLLVLTAGSTLAGNMTLLGAAANVIVLEAAESRCQSCSFLEFVKSGLPVTLVTSAITIGFLMLFA